MNQTLKPLRVPKVIRAALRLYRDNYKAYLKVAFIANLWSLLPLFILLLIIAVLTILFTTLVANNSSDFGLWLLGVLPLIIIGWLILVIYCSSKFFTNAALLSRLTFSQLTNQPETVQEGRRNITKLWKFFWLQFMVNLIISVFNIGLSIAQWLVFDLPASKIQGIIGFILTITGNVCYFVAYLWIYVRFFIPEVPFVIEPEKDIFQAITRSWKLSQGFSWQIILIVIASFFITLPLYVFSAIPIVIALISVAPLLQQSTVSPAILIGLWTSISGAIVSSVLIFSFLNIAALPFWQVIKGIIYYDLCFQKNLTINSNQ
ncbi:hypothetical protein PCC8801_1482 [Rippkaea orientalis PCC 8801]|uniref:Glycerophosphoryl diester phosphodiesterase membrane domain-containing protein n=1 Tax=Rippkaea orientalis (strain PCC 8801 / RF-1) TaxID=41431 RepID=B7JUJ4_RIPO1|nr:hypothetical protein [Rippkaea orientalis]ACK65538.1 hypothetical protein PCC8801_1482 [Rippkaea orientalis PCC 8801]